MLSYSRNSRFAPNCEPMNPLGRCRAKQSRGGSNSYNNSNRIMRKDIYDETFDFCQDMLKKIKETYDKASNMKGDNSRVIVNMNQDLNKMKEKAKRAGIDPEKEIRDGENNSSIKKKILNDISTAENLIMLIQTAK